MAAAYSIIIHGLLWLSTKTPGLISIIFALMIFFLDLHYAQENSVSLVNYGISIVVLIIALLDFRKNGNGLL